MDFTVPDMDLTLPDINFALVEFAVLAFQTMDLPSRKKKTL
jgi:hypothetical protein